MRLCECGCEQPAPISPYTSTSRGYVKGEPRRFISGHQREAVAQRVSESWQRRLGPEWSKDAHGCWIWQRGLNQDGYGRTLKDRHRTFAHRVYYEQAHGPIPTGWHVHHLCGVPSCVNPAHLKAVSPIAHGGERRCLGDRAIAFVKASGESNRALARRFGVSRTTISRIRSGKVAYAMGGAR